MPRAKDLNPKQREALFNTLQARFEKHLNRHQGLAWVKVQARLAANPEKLWSLNEMESTGGEPDVVGQDKKTGEFIFLIARRKVPKAVAAFVMTALRSKPGRNTNPPTTRWRWLRQWALSY